MRIYVDEAEREIVTAFQSIARDPASWEGWKCLSVETPELASCARSAEIQVGVSMLLEYVFRSKLGAAYFCTDGEIYVICRNVSEEQMIETGRAITAFIHSQSELSSCTEVYDLATGGEKLVLSSAYRRLTQRLIEGKTLREYDRMSQVFPLMDLVSVPETSVLDPEKNKRVLLVEDDAVTRWLVRNALKGECALATSADAGKALSLYRAFRPDMVLLDINLPDGNGIDVMMDLLKEDPAACVVMFSSQDTLDSRVATINSGARGFVSKPFTRERLMGYLRTCPARR